MTEGLKTLRLHARKRAGDPAPELDLLGLDLREPDRRSAADTLTERDALFAYYAGGDDQAPLAPGRLETLPGFMSKAGVWVDPIRYVTTEPL